MASLPPPELMDEMVEEILLRIPPDDPARLLRASVVCKPWRRLLTDPAFLRRYRAFHRAPPILGFFSYDYDMDGGAARFVPTATFRPRDPERRNCPVLDCRHGRALLRDCITGDLFVWDPITGEDQHVPDIENNSGFHAAVLCAAADCDHLCCHGGPFLVVLVITKILEHEGFAGYARAWVYSSEAGEWSTPTTMGLDYCYYMLRRPPVLAGDKIYFMCESNLVILCYDLHGERGLSLIPGCEPDLYTGNSLHLTPAGGGILRFASLQAYKLRLWSLETMEPDGVAAWKQCGVIQLDLLHIDSLFPPKLIGFVNAPIGDVVFVRTDAGVFTIELESHKIRKVDYKVCGYNQIFPYTSFVTPDCAIGRELQ